MSTLYATFEDVARSLEIEEIESLDDSFTRFIKDSSNEEILARVLKSVRPFMIVASSQVVHFSDFQEFSKEVVLQSDLEEFSDVEVHNKESIFLGVNDEFIFNQIKASLAREKEEACGICLEAFGYGQGSAGKAVSLPCGHVYHDECIRGWVVQQLEELQKTQGDAATGATCCFCRAELNIKLVPLRFMTVLVEGEMRITSESEDEFLSSVDHLKVDLGVSASDLSQVDAAATVTLVQHPNDHHWAIMEMRSKRRKLRREMLRFRSRYSPY